jgi:hypothetical protein
MEQSYVFEETYRNYLSRIAGLDVKTAADRLGAKMAGNEMIIPFFAKPHRISAEGITDPLGSRPSFSVCVILFKYLLLCPAYEPRENDWVSYKDFKDAAPFAGSFINHAEAPIAKYFSGRVPQLEIACRKIGGHRPLAAFSYDLCMQFNALPQIPVLLLFNDGDEEFTARSTVLFERRAESFLDMECLAMVGMLLFEYLKIEGEKVDNV